MQVFIDLLSCLYGWKNVLIVVAGLAGAYAVLQTYLSHKMRQRRAKWAAYGKDVVVVHSIERSKFTPNISPFPMKLETWLRMAEIPYKVDFEEPMSTKGKTPWMTLNGEEVADSQFCIDLLRRKFEKDMSSHLSPEERATAQAYRLMMEEHFYWPIALQRWVYRKGQDLPEITSSLPWFMPLIMPMITRNIRNQATGQGVGRHSEAQVIELGLSDLRALSVFLGKKKFLMGDRAVEEDCGIFGILSQVVWNLPGSPFEQAVNRELVNLKEYCFRMRDTFWPDWGSCLSPPQL